MSKFGIGESVYFRDSEISVSVIPCMSVMMKTDNLSGRVTGVVDCGKEETAFPMTKDIIEEYEKKFNENARNIMIGVDPAVPDGDMNGAWGEFGKMSKSRCVKLLESYRAERDKVKKGRKFERCLRDSVVDEALERAIELLKGGAE